MRSRPSFSSCLLAFASLTCAPALAQDPGSLRVRKETATAVRLAWTDASPTSYCIHRFLVPPATVPVAEAAGLVHVDDPPAVAAPEVWYYDVLESPPEGCFGTTPCVSAGALACGVPFVGDTSSGCGSATDDWTGCGAAGLTGPECAHALAATVAGDYTVTVTGTPGLEVVVVRDAACDPAACVASGSPSAVFTAVAGETFQVLVDGAAGASGPYTLTVSCPSGTPTCMPAGSLSCGATMGGDTSAAATSDVLAAYAGCAVVGLDGREQAWTFTAASDDLLRVALTAGDPALRLIVLRDDGAGCGPSSPCVAEGDAEATFSATNGTTYVVVVDGPAGSEGPYQLMTACGVAECAALGPVTCGALRMDANSNSGVSALSSYPCTAANESGFEYFYEFIAAQTGDLTIDLTGLTADLDVVVLEDVVGCQAGSCVGFGDSTVTVPIVAGTRYFIGIEGRDGADGRFTASFTCNVPPQDCMPAGNVSCAEAAFANNGALGSTDSVDAYPACVAWDESGPEYVYSWIAPGDVTALVSLGMLTADLDVFVLAESGAGCRPDDCIAHGDDFASFDAEEGRLYFFVVDGRAGARSDFRLYVDCFPAPGACLPAAAIACGASVAGNNAQPGSTDAIDGWPGCTPFPEDGPEVAYEYLAAADGTIDVTITGTSAELDVFVLHDTGAGCTSADCITAGDSTASFAATMGERYFVVVDGRAGAVSDFTLSLTCR